MYATLVHEKEGLPRVLWEVRDGSRVWQVSFWPMQNEYSIISDSGREVTPTSLLGRRIIAAAKRYDGPRPDDPRGKPLADLVRAWRTFRKKPLNTAEAAEVLGMPARTIEGIEQGRPFRYEKLLRLALESA